MENPVLPSSCVTPAGTSIEVENEWEENTHTHVFPVVSELDYLLLEHVVFSDDLDFFLWEMLQQGGS